MEKASMGRFFGLRVAVFATALALMHGCGKGTDTAASTKDETKSALTAAPAGEGPAKPAPSTADCDRCRAKACVGGSNSEGLDLAAGCFKTPGPKFVPSPDANFASDCKAAVDCAFKHDCAYDPSKGPVHCYCGSRAVDECITDGPAEDAACVAEWRAATRSTNNKEILQRFSQIDYPSGWAFHLLECDRDQCGARSDLGRCTP
jgi:hypothetical protein